MYRNLLTSLPSALQNFGAAQTVYLGFHVELAHAIDLIFQREVVKRIPVVVVLFAHRVQPVIYHATFASHHGGLNAPATIVTDNHNMADF